MKNIHNWVFFVIGIALTVTNPFASSSARIPWELIPVVYSPQGEYDYALGLSQDTSAPYVNLKNLRPVSQISGVSLGRKKECLNVVYADGYVLSLPTRGLRVREKSRKLYIPSNDGRSVGFPKSVD